MKNREEYLASIYAKRDKVLAKRKKTISLITSTACLVLCFIAVFSFVPKRLVKKTNTAETINENRYSDSRTLDKIIFEEEATFFHSSEIYLHDDSFVINEAISTVTNDANANIQGGIKNSENSFRAEIAAEATTRQMNFGYAGGKFDPNQILSGDPAIAPENPPKDYDSAVTEPYNEKPDSVEEVTKIKTTKASLRTSDEAIEEATKIVPDEDAAKIIEENTQVTVTKTASDETLYTVYFYTSNKTFTIVLDAVTLRVLECTEKNIVTEKESYISYPWFPETTDALPEFKPQ